MAETTTTTSSEEKSTKSRGASFPYLSLPQAVAIVKDAGSYAKQHSRSAMAQYAGHTTDNSGPFKQKLAALKDWGLINIGGGQITLTDSAMNLAHPVSAQRTAEILRSSFLGCAIFRKVYDGVAKGVELDQAQIGNLAVNTHHVGVGAKSKFIQSFVESAEMVGLAEPSAGGKIRFLAVAVAHEAPADDDEPTSEDQEGDYPAPTPKPKANSSMPAVVAQSWQAEQYAISFEIRVGKPLKAADYTLVGNAVSEIEKLAKALSEGAEDAAQ